MFVPIKPPAGEKVATLLSAVFTILKLVAVPALPFNFQAKVKASLFASETFAVRLTDPVAPTTVPVAAGEIESQLGGVFLTTDHVVDAELVPLLAVATNVLVPVLNAEEANVFVAAAPLMGLPFKFHVTAQLASLGVTVKVFDVEAAAAIRFGELGVEAEIVQVGNTFTVHAHEFVS